MRRILRGLALWFALPLALLVGTLLILLAHLDAGPIRSWVLAAVRDGAGLSVDYDQASLSPFSGLRLRGLRIPSPPPYEAVAPDLLRLGALDVRWSLGTLLGHRPEIEEISLDDLTVTVVVDDEGTNSLASLLAGLKPSPSPGPPPPPTSHLLASLATDGGGDFGRVSAALGPLQVIRRRGGTPYQRITLHGLALDGKAGIGPGGLDGDLRIGTKEHPVDLKATVEELPPPGADARPGREVVTQFWAQATVAGSQARAALGLRLVRQDLDPALPQRLLDLDVAARFAPQDRRTVIELTQGSILDGAVTAELTAELVDGGESTPGIRSAKATANLERLAAALPASLGTLSAPGGNLALSVRNLELAPFVRILDGGELRADATLPSIDARHGDNRAHLEGATIALRGRAGATPAPLRLDLQLPVGSLLVAAGGSSITATKLLVRGSLDRLRLPASNLAAATGDAAIDLTFGALSARSAGTTATASGVGLSLAAPLPGGGPIALRGTLPIAHLAISGAGSRVVLGPVRADLRATIHSPTRFDALVDATLGALASHLGDGDATVGDARLKLGLAGIVLADDPLATVGAATLRGTLGRASLQRAGITAIGGGIGIDLSAISRGAPPYRVDLKLPVAGLEIRRDRGGTLLPKAAGRIDLALVDLVPDLARPIRSRARIRAAIDLGPFQASATIDKASDRAGFDLHTRADRLGAVRLLLPESVTKDHEIPWERIALAVDSRGAIAGFDRPTVDADTVVKLRGAALKSGKLDIGADAIDATLAFHGPLRRHALTLDLALAGPRWDGRRSDGTHRISLRSTLDLDRPRIDLHFEGAGAAGPEGTLALQMDFDAATRTVRYAIDGRIARLGFVAALLPPSLREHHRLDWERLTVQVRGHGAAREVVRGFGRDLSPHLAERPLEVLRGDEALDVTLGELHYRGDRDLQIDTPLVTVHSAGRADDDARHAEVSLVAPELHVVSAGRRIDLTAFAPTATVDGEGRLPEGQLRVLLGTTIGAVRQSFVPGYPIADLAFAARARGHLHGAIHLEEVRIDNPGGGTHLDFKGGLDLTAGSDGREATGKVQANGNGNGNGNANGNANGSANGTDDRVPGRRSLFIEGALAQRLDPLHVEGVRARGRIEVPFRLESGDLALLHAVATLRLADVHLDLAARGLSVTDLDGQIPMVQDILLGPGGPALLGGASASAYPRLRFNDHQPFLAGERFVTAQRVRVGEFALGPVAANVHIDRNLFALDQLEAEAAGGRVTGQCLVDWRGDDTEVRLRGGVTGLRPSDKSDERLDANAALTLSPYRLALEGRAEVIRIGRAHLEALLDHADPYHADVATNRVRQALRIGYPKQVRLRFERGFAALKITLGGLTDVVRIDEIRGVPLGPLLERYLGPALLREEAP
ncbi:MAG: hypothetical protein EXR72_17340 [Myxococcales bacterium]|nr:hypothetical protein [Myxococcales bacterium]